MYQHFLTPLADVQHFNFFTLSRPVVPKVGVGVPQGVARHGEEGRKIPSIKEIHFLNNLKLHI